MILPTLSGYDDVQTEASVLGCKWLLQLTGLAMVMMTNTPITSLKHWQEENTKIMTFHIHLKSLSGNWRASHISHWYLIYFSDRYHYQYLIDTDVLTRHSRLKVLDCGLKVELPAYLVAWLEFEFTYGLQ